MIPSSSSALEHLYTARARLGSGTLGPPSEVSEQLHRLWADPLGICPRWNESPRGSAPSRSGCPLLGAHPIERSERPSRTLPPETGSPKPGTAYPGVYSPPGSARGDPPPPSGLRVEESVGAGCPSAFGAAGIPGGVGLPFISSFNHSSIARVQVCGWWPGGKEKAAGVLRAAKRRLWLAAVRAAFARAARARVCRPASPCSRSASRSCRCAAVCGRQQMLCRSCCRAGQCCANVACVVPRVHVRWVIRDRTDPSSRVHAETSRRSAAPRHVVCFCALVGAVCHCGRTALQPAHLRARGGRGVLSACCLGRARASELPSRRVAAWPASACWAR